jgi:hypothetical protein
MGEEREEEEMREEREQEEDGGGGEKKMEIKYERKGTCKGKRRRKWR